MEERELPRPDSPQLKELFPSDLHRAIYRVLYERRTDPPTMQEVQDAVGRDLGEQAAQQVHFSKRLRELRDHFEIPHPSAADGYRYRLSGWRAVPRGESGISTKLAARVRRHARCAMCGKTPNEDGVRLHIDHKVPREWGGKSEEKNLQALCSDCNEGKKAYFATYDEYADKIRQAANHDEPHRRIGELLKAFGRNEVPDDLIELVASSRQYQADRQKRLRELRELELKIAFRRKKEGTRVRVYYWLEEEPPEWPKGEIRSAIRERERAKKAS